jgi:hypothetical protein
MLLGIVRGSHKRSQAALLLYVTSPVAGEVARPKQVSTRAELYCRFPTVRPFSRLGLEVIFGLKCQARLVIHTQSSQVRCTYAER